MFRGLVLAITITACSSISTVRVQSESVSVGPHLRPIAIVHAQVTSAYLLFIAIPGHVSLDKVVDIKIEITPDDGIWTLRKLIGWRTAEASGVAVVVEDEPKP
jgi:hypothetical protein